MGSMLARIYFDLVYNRLYDFTTARLLRYVEVQERLAWLLAPSAGHRILCVGLGTGNELSHLSRFEQDLQLTGIDFSATALRRARHKGNGTSQSLLLMDAHSLGFRPDSFDRLLAYHLTDFVESPEAATREMLRVLRPGGRFVISYPSKGEGLGLGMALLRHGIRNRAPTAGAKVHGALSGLLTGLVYLPLMLRPRPTTYTRRDLEALFLRLGAAIDVIEQDPVYRDHIVSGTKTTGGEHGES